MGRIARVEKVSVVDGVRVVTVDDGSGSPDDVELYLPPGVDSMPMEDDLLLLVYAVGNDGPAGVAVMDEIEPDGAGGGYRIYSRDSSGAVVAFIRLGSDGAVEISNENGTIEIASSGKIVLNGNLEVLP